MNFQTLPALLLTLSTYPVWSSCSLPTVLLDAGTFVGEHNSTTNTNQFLGIPFAQPPLDDLRFNLPVPNSPYEGTHDASSFGLSCFAQDISAFTLPSNVSASISQIFGEIGPANVNASEDCLTINVVQPAGVSEDVLGTGLPVIVWIYGGGFQTGGANVFPGAPMVSYSVQLGKPILFVSFNYRLSAFGWIAGKEVEEAGVGNIGLRDQRLALKWVQKYISAFGGDPTRVTIFGESAGAISIAYHLVANNGNNEGLFRGAIMDSGSTLPTKDITQGQKWFDVLAEETGCSTSPNALDCLRAAPLDSLLAAINGLPTFVGPQSLNLVYGPAADGTFITESPQSLVQAGKVANIPIINGDDDDEGTVFTLALQNITTEQDLFNYLSSNYFPGATSSQINEILALYPMNYTAGSPFGTGLLNALTPQYKRLAAIQGDLIFQGPRRFLLQHVSAHQPSWSFLNKKRKSDPILGSCHVSDLIDALFVQSDLMRYFINFVHNLNPNDGELPTWPTYTVASPQLLTLQDDPNESIVITQDTFRAEGISYLTQLLLEFPLDQ